MVVRWLDFDRHCTVLPIEGTGMWLERSQESLQCNGCAADTKMHIGFGIQSATQGTQHVLLCLDCIRAAAGLVFQVEEGKLKI